MEYADIFNGLFCNVASTSLMLPVQDKIKGFFSNSAEHKVGEVNVSVAIPLAVGYYYNMLDKIEDLLKGDNLVLKEHIPVTSSDILSQISIENNEEQLKQKLSLFKIHETKILGRFDYSQIKLKIIYPKNITNRNMRDCSFFLNENTKHASLESVTAGRPYGVNFIADDEEMSGITIVDYARPIEVIYKYFNEFKGYSDLELKNNQWEQEIEKEMQSFLGTLKYLIEEKSTFLYRVTTAEAL